MCKLIGDYTVDERALRMVMGGVHGNASTLIHHQQILILVQDIKCHRRGRTLPRRIVERENQAVPRRQNGGGTRTLSVKPNPLRLKLDTADDPCGEVDMFF